VEVERIYREWDVDLKWAPFLLDPSVPPEGRERARQTTPDAPQSHLELRGEQAGVEFRRGRAFTPNSMLALQATEYAQHHGTPEQVTAFHRALFKAYFTDFENISDIDVLARIAGEQGFDADDLRDALATERFREQLEAGIAHSYAIGVTGIPTFIFNDRYAVVGAQEYETFEMALTQLGARRRDGVGPAPDAGQPPAASDLGDFE
jgi:predicted DsbA family dithiol-disulfide isomerase